MIAEKDPERENTYYINSDVAAEDGQNESGILDKLIELFRF